MWKYEGKLLVVNLGTNLTLDNWDKIVLQDDNQVCSIVSREVVDDDYTLKWTSDNIQTTYTNIFIPTYSSELQWAYDYAYWMGISTASSIYSADMNWVLLRSHMAKMMVNYAKEVLDKTVDSTKVCFFTDISNQTEEIKWYIIKACQMWLMGNGLKKFNPNWSITKAEFWTVLSRALYGNKNDWGSVRYTNHLQAMYNASIMKDISSPNVSEQRGYVMLMMQRADNR